MNIKTSWNGYVWLAIDDDTYDGPGGPGERGSPIGSGVTAADAINDLVEQIIDRIDEPTKSEVGAKK